MRAFRTYLPPLLRKHFTLLASAVMMISLSLVILNIGKPKTITQHAATEAVSTYPGQMKIFGASTLADDLTYYSQAVSYVNAKGITNDRFWVDWYVAQPKSCDKNYFDWSYTDARMNILPVSETLLGLLGDNIIWDTKTCGKTVPDFNMDGMLTQNRPPLAQGAGSAWSDYEVFLYNAVSRYGPNANGLGTGYGQNRIHTWEVMNEPDGMTGDKYVNGQTYGQILKRAIVIIKLADPNAKIISGGISDYNGQYAGNQTDLDPHTKLFIQGVATTGALSGVDGFGDHPYIGFSYDNSLSLLSYIYAVSQEVKKDTGLTLPLWFTEAGYNSNDLGISCGPYCLTTKDTAGRAMAQNLVQILASGNVHALYFFMTNTMSITNPIWNPDGYALMKKTDVNNNWIETDRGNVFYTFKKDVYDKGYQFLTRETVGDAYWFVFTNGQNYLHIFWSKNPVTIRFSGVSSADIGKVRLTDYRDTPMGLESYYGTGQLNIGPSPVYLYSPNEILLSQQTVFPTGTGINPQGAVGANCYSISAWSCDASDYSKPVTLSLSSGTTALGTVQADQVNGDASYQYAIRNLCGGYNAHHFSMLTPDSLKDGNPHTASAVATNIAEGSSTPVSLGTSPSFTCNLPPTPNPLPSGRWGPVVRETPAPIPQGR